MSTAVESYQPTRRVSIFKEVVQGSGMTDEVTTISAQTSPDPEKDS